MCKLYNRMCMYTRTCSYYLYSVERMAHRGVLVADRISGGGTSLGCSGGSRGSILAFLLQVLLSLSLL